MRILVSLLSFLTVAQAFVSQGSRHATSTATSSLDMAPRYDKQAQVWYPTSPDEGPEAGYPLVNTLLLHGPNPFVQRVINGAQYEQAVLKFMAQDKVDRQTAMGNMDAYFANPNDWAVNRLAAEKGGYNPDYVTLKPKALALTLTWSAIVAVVASRVGWALYTGGDFWSFLK